MSCWIRGCRREVVFEMDGGRESCGLHYKEGDMSVGTGKCKICGTPTNTSFGFGGSLHYYCEAHKDQLFEKVTGKKPKATKPK